MQLSPLAAKLSLSRGRLGSRSVAHTSAPSLLITRPAPSRCDLSKHAMHHYLCMRHHYGEQQAQLRYTSMGHRIQDPWSSLKTSLSLTLLILITMAPRHAAHRFVSKQGDTPTKPHPALKSRQRLPLASPPCISKYFAMTMLLSHTAQHPICPPTLGFFHICHFCN